MVTIEPFWQDSDLELFWNEVPREWTEQRRRLTPDELSYCLQSRHENLQLSRAQHRLMVKEIFQDPHLEVRRGPFGRPLVNPDFDISFSHKNNHALIGRTRAPRKIGVDLEARQQNIDWSVFMNFFFHSEDLESIATISELPDWNKHLACLAVFSAKEAFFKSQDIEFRPRALVLEFAGLSRGFPEFKAHSEIGRATKRAFSFLFDDFVVSVCIT